MYKYLLFFISILVLIFSKPSYCQDNSQTKQKGQQAQDSTTISGKPEKQMPFRKGRVMLGASAFISSGSVRFDTTAFSGRRLTNDYNIEFNAGYFVIDKLMIGLLFRTRRVSSTEYIKRENEFLQIGPYLRYYIGTSVNGGIFLSGNINYTIMRDEVSFSIGNTQVNRTINGNGFGTGLGVGYSYSPFDRIALDMGISYMFIFGKSKITNNFNRQESFENFILNEFLFGLGVNVIL